MLIWIWGSEETKPFFYANMTLAFWYICKIITQSFSLLREAWKTVNMSVPCHPKNTSMNYGRVSPRINFLTAWSPWESLSQAIQSGRCWNCFVFFCDGTLQTILNATRKENFFFSPTSCCSLPIPHLLLRIGETFQTSGIWPWEHLEGAESPKSMFHFQKETTTHPRAS